MIFSLQLILLVPDVVICSVFSVQSQNIQPLCFILCIFWANICQFTSSSLSSMCSGRQNETSSQALQFSMEIQRLHLSYLDIFAHKISHTLWDSVLGISLCNFLSQARRLNTFLFYSSFWTLKHKMEFTEEQNMKFHKPHQRSRM